MEISSSYFVYINVAVVLIYIILISIGFIKGFLYEIVSLAYTGLSILASWFLCPIFASAYPIVNVENLNNETALLAKFIDLNPIINSIIYFVIIFLLMKVLYVVLNIILKGLNKIPVIGGINRLLGGIMGIVNATLITLILSLLLTMPIFKNSKEIINGTVFKYVNKYTEQISSYLLENGNLDHIKNQFDNFDIDNAREEFKQWLNLNN